MRTLFEGKLSPRTSQCQPSTLPLKGTLVLYNFSVYHFLPISHLICLPYSALTKFSSIFLFKIPCSHHFSFSSEDTFSKFFAFIISLLNTFYKNDSWMWKYFHFVLKFLCNIFYPILSSPSIPPISPHLPTIQHHDLSLKN